jgi:hypothetical protein
MEMICYAEISANFQRNTLCFIQEDRISHNHCSRNVEEMLLSHSQAADKDMVRD